MQKKFCIPFACSLLTLFALCATMFGQDQARTKPLKLQLRYAEPITHGSDRAARAQVIQSGRAASVLPVWNFQALSTRDGNIYAGSMVGANPAVRGSDAHVSVTGQVVPIILKLHTIGVSINPKTGKIKTKPGNTTFDPTVADNVCLTAPNNMPVDLLRQVQFCRTPSSILVGRMWVPRSIPMRSSGAIFGA